MIVQYRATNTFGGKTVNRMAATFDKDGGVIAGPMSLDE
jgi:hypothetical protein